VWLEVVQGNNACNCRCECSRDLRIAPIGDMPDASDIEVMKRSAECTAHLGRGPRKVNGSCVDHIDCKTLGLEPVGDRFDVLGSQAELLLELLGSKPFVVSRRAWILDLLKQLSSSSFFFPWQPQLELHVLHRKGVGNPPTVIACISLGNCVTRELNSLTLVNGLRD